MTFLMSLSRPMQVIMEKLKQVAFHSLKSYTPSHIYILPELF